MQINRMLASLTNTTAPAAVIVIRFLTGSIFLSEGVQKFLNPAELGFGRFEKLGIIYPSITAPLVGVVEITCGILLLLGLLVRIATIPLLITMSVAIISTKLSVLLEHGFLKFAHEARTDFSMIMTLIFLLIVGAGSISLDNEILKRSRSDAEL